MIEMPKKKQDVPRPSRRRLIEKRLNVRSKKTLTGGKPRPTGRQLTIRLRLTRKPQTTRQQKSRRPKKKLKLQKKKR